MWPQNPSEALPHQDPIKKEKQNHLEDRMFPVLRPLKGIMAVFPFHFPMAYPMVMSMPDQSLVTRENTQKTGQCVPSIFSPLVADTYMFATR